jgi:hypothetical protein
MEVSGQFRASAALPPGKGPRYPLDRRLGGLLGRSGCGGEEKNSQPPPVIESWTPIVQSVAQRCTDKNGVLSNDKRPVSFHVNKSVYDTFC